MSKQVLILSVLVGSFGAFGQNQEQAEFFEKNVRPVLATKCQM
jgi:hypothetical protein